MLGADAFMAKLKKLMAPNTKKRKKAFRGAKNESQYKSMLHSMHSIELAENNMETYETPIIHVLDDWVNKMKEKLKTMGNESVR